MKPLYTEEEYKKARVRDSLLCECYQCGKTFYKNKREIVKVLKGLTTGKYCSKECVAIGMTKITTLNCSNCNKEITKHLHEIKKSKTKRFFCDMSCAATYNNKHKTHGTRRSKLERWLETKLKTLYPNLNILYNQKGAVDSELDIYIPSLNLAFELNGIFHYEPIYGVDKLNQIQANDKSKTKACHDAKIDLCIIDVSKQKYFKGPTSKPYLKIITDIIDARLSTI